MPSFLRRFPDLPLALVLFVVTAALFAPATWWIAGQTLAHEQLRQSFFLLVFAAIILGIDHRRTLRPVVQVSNRSIQLLAGAFVLMGLGMFIHASFLPLLALALALAAFIHLVFGDTGFKLSLPWIAGFGGFLAFVLIFQFADWPLRQLAGSQAGQFLALMGRQVELGGVLQPSALLIMAVDGRMYEVATECNGFGLVSTSVILALLLTFARPLAIGWKIVAVVLAFVSGFTFNILRIIGIVTLAPHFPAHYDMVHEVVGLSALFGGLAFLWWLLGGGRAPAPSQSLPSPTQTPPLTKEVA